jgi:hypothetical protein
MIDGITFGNVMIDCADETRLCAFYASLLGWKRSVLYGRPALTSESGLILLFHQEEDYIPPVWPEEAGVQQKQMHFDFQVPDVPLAVRQAIALGARRSSVQFGSEKEAFVTLFDPDGHPFCLCADTNIG